MAFQQGLSGLYSSSKALDVIGNNIANTSTVGFKGSSTHFADVYANSLAGAGAGSAGVGSSVSNIAQQFNQGNITATNNPMDVAINGAGFFRLSQNGNYTYTRNGQFHVDKDNFVVNDQGFRLQGWAANTQGVVVPGTPGDIIIDKSYQAPQATGSTPNNIGVVAKLNLDSRATAKDQATTPFDPYNPDTYNYSTALTIYDTRGNPHTMTTYLVKTTDPVSVGVGAPWRMYTTVDGKNGMFSSTDYPGAITLDSQEYTNMEFNSAGKLVTPDLSTIPTMSIDWNMLDPTLGATAPQTFKINLVGTTSYGDAFASNTLTQDGYATGKLAGVNINADGMVQGRYSNGQTKNMGRIVMYDFANPNGLKPTGNNQWVETYTSGQPLPGAPETSQFGSLQSSSVEESNVDMTSELVAMIVQQRNYQANSQTIKTQDQILQTIVNLR